MVACSSVSAIAVPLYDALGGDDAVAHCIVHSGMELVFVQVCRQRHQFTMFLGYLLAYR